MPSRNERAKTAVVLALLTCSCLLPTPQAIKCPGGDVLVSDGDGGWSCTPLDRQISTADAGDQPRPDAGELADADTGPCPADCGYIPTPGGAMIYAFDCVNDCESLGATCNPENGGMTFLCCCPTPSDAGSRVDAGELGDGGQAEIDAMDSGCIWWQPICPWPDPPPNECCAYEGLTWVPYLDGGSCYYPCTMEMPAF